MITGLLEFATALYENHQKIEFYNFLEALKTPKNKTLVESAQRGFTALYEEEGEGRLPSERMSGAEKETTKIPSKVTGDFKPYADLARSIYAGTLAKFSGNGPAETAKLMGILKNGVGKLKVTSPYSFKDFKVITDYEYIPNEPSTDEDKSNAKSIMISTVIPRIVFKGQTIGRTEDYTDAGLELISDAIKGGYGTVKSISERCDAFISVYDPAKKGTFLAYDKAITHDYTNIVKDVTSEVEGTEVVSKVWNRDKEYKKGEIVHHGKRNYKALEEVPAGIEPTFKNKYWLPMPSGADVDNLSSPVHKSKMDEGEETTIEDTISGTGEKEIEKNLANSDMKTIVNKLMSKIPNDANGNRLREILNLRFNEELGLEEISEKIGVSKQRIDQILKQSYALMRQGEKRPEELE